MPVEESGSFTYSSQPHSAPTRSSQHYRNDDLGVPLTMMSDPRVIRGNTHSLARKITKSKTELSKSMTLNRAHHLAKEQNTVARPTYTYEVKSFSNNEIDVSKFLIQQNENGPLKKEADNQTNDFILRPQSPEYVPRKTGIDRSTQVEDVRDLFNFDLEVVPLLEVIVRKTLEQALFEVQSEEELLELEKAATQFLHEHDVESEWTKMKETEAIKEYTETQARISALNEIKRKELKTRALIAGVQMIRQIMPNIVENIVNDNLKDGVWKEPNLVEARADIVPPVIHNAFLRINAHDSAEALIDELLYEAQERFTTFPLYNPVKEVRKVLLHMKFVTVVENEGEVDEDGNKIVKKSDDNFVTVTFPIGSEDSVLSLERRIRAELTRLKVPPVVEEGAEPPPFDTVFASKLPDPNTPMNLLSRFTQLLYPNTINRDIAKDAYLWNFNIPSIIKFEIVNN